MIDINSVRVDYSLYVRTQQAESYRLCGNGIQWYDIRHRSEATRNAVHTRKPEQTPTRCVVLYYINTWWYNSRFDPTIN